MKQQCYLAMIYTNWVIGIGVLISLLWKGMWTAALAWAVLVPLALWAYVRVFPSISRALGYGDVHDEPAQLLPKARTKVTLYTALSCPFCPIVRNRLLALRSRMEFSLEEVDVTLKPQLLTSKGIRAVPVVEANGRQLCGNATSAQLAELISSQVPSASESAAR